MSETQTMSRISISGLAWPAEHDEEATRLAKALGYAGIEVVPGKVVSGMDDIAGIKRYREKLAALDLSIPAFQAITYGIEDCQLFGSEIQRDNLRRHLETVARLAGAAGASVCVFGAPKLRDPGSLSVEEAFAQAASFFADLAPVFADQNSTLSIEPNPEYYGCKFTNTTAEAIALVKTIDRPGIGLQIDTGAMAINREPEKVIGQAVPYAAHCHASEPDLAPLGRSGVDHARYGQCLKQAGYDGWRSVEMLVQDDWRDNMRAAADIMNQCYR